MQRSETIHGAWRALKAGYGKRSVIFLVVTGSIYGLIALLNPWMIDPTAEWGPGLTVPTHMDPKSPGRSLPWRIAPDRPCI